MPQCGSCLLVFFLLCGKISLQNASPFYTAGVVDYHPVSDAPNVVTATAKNAEVYQKIIKIAVDYKVDIIIFPENGLSSNYEANYNEILSASTFVPNPQDLITPCDFPSNYSRYLEELSCSAKNNKLYVVINVHEKEKYSSASTCKLRVYNTNVVFDRTGTIIARYRKYNLVRSEAEKLGISITGHPELSIFTTDFNVTFGQFICFDILHKSPAWTMIRQKNVTDIIFSTRWFSELPFLTALQTMFGFSYVNDVNFLGSSYNFPVSGSMGSGIFAGPRILDKFWSSKPSTVLLVANVAKVLENGEKDPSVEVGSKMHHFYDEDMMDVSKPENFTEELFWYDNLTLYTTEVLRNARTNYSKKLCNGGLCCNFDVSWSAESGSDESKFYTYRFVVFKGVRLMSELRRGIEVCGIVSCLDGSLQSCGRISQEKPAKSKIFSFLNVSRYVDTNFEDFKFYFPTVLQTNTDLIDAGFFSFNIDKTENVVNMFLKKPFENLMTFAIYGRNVENDEVILNSE